MGLAAEALQIVNRSNSIEEDLIRLIMGQGSKNRDTRDEQLPETKAETATSKKKTVSQDTAPRETSRQAEVKHEDRRRLVAAKRGARSPHARKRPR